MNIYDAIRVGELDHTVSQILAVPRPATVATYVSLTDCFTEAEAIHSVFNAAANRLKTLSVLEQADYKLDQSIRSFFGLVDAYALFPAGPLNTAALVIKRVTDGFGRDITRLNYEEEASACQAMFSELEKPEYANCIVAIPMLADTIQTATNALIDFNSSQLEYDKAKASELEAGSASSHKRTMLAVMNKRLLQTLDTVNYYHHDEFNAYVGTINEIIKNVNETILKRLNKEEQEDEQPIIEN